MWPACASLVADGVPRAKRAPLPMRFRASGYLWLLAGLGTIALWITLFAVPESARLGVGRHRPWFEATSGLTGCSSEPRGNVADVDQSAFSISAPATCLAASPAYR